METISKRSDCFLKATQQGNKDQIQVHTNLAFFIQNIKTGQIEGGVVFVFGEFLFFVFTGNGMNECIECIAVLFYTNWLMKTRML